MNIDKNIELEIQEIISKADACLIFSGAGMGGDSGLSVFRGKEGLWEKVPAAKKRKMKFSDLANPYNYVRHKEIVIPFYLERLYTYQNTEPHEGFGMLLEYCNSLKKGYFSITSNVDGHFQKANYKKENVYEVHGSINYWQCSKYGCETSKMENFVEIKVDKDGDKEIEFDSKNKELVTCKRCGHYLRPNILMFEDFNWNSMKATIAASFYENYCYDIESYNVAIIEIGAGKDLPTIRKMAANKAKSFNTKVIRINPQINILEESDKNVLCVQSNAKKGIEYILSLLSKKD